MAYIKNPTEGQKREWHKAAEESGLEMQEMIRDLAESWKENPETIAEMLSFGSRMYQYSVRNNMLIYRQNPHAAYVQSFQAWKKMGVSVKKGERGCKVYVPVNATLLKIDGHLVPLEHATEEQKLRYKAGEIESVTQKSFSIGNVFDISQTTYPKEDYPKLFHMGYASVLHGAAVKGLIEYARQELKCPVQVEDMKSISARGSYAPGEHTIRINQLLNDTERLSTLAHELGHALIHQDGGVGKSKVRKELEADALGIMTASHFGIAVTDGRKRHLSDCYKAYEKEYFEAVKKQEPAASFGEVLADVFKVYKREIPAINEHMEKHLQKAEAELIKQGISIPDYSKDLPGKSQVKGNVPGQMPERDGIYDRIKQEIHILDYARMHGIETQRVGRYYTIKDADSVRIDPDKNCFWRNSGRGQTTEGSVIDFATAFVHDEDLHEALTELSGLIGGGQERSQEAGRYAQTREGRRREPRPLEECLPKRNANMHRVYAYLTQTRFIEPEVVQDFVNRKMLYQDERGNCVFVSYDAGGKLVFATLRGTLSERKFVGDIEGCNYRKGFYIDNGADRLIVTESVIDAMSVMSILHGQGVDYKQFDYLPLNGAAKHIPVMLHLAEQPKEQVLLALDNDLTGVKDMQKLREEILDGLSGLDLKEEQVTFHVPNAKDWNEDLVSCMRTLRPASEIPFIEGGDLPEIRYCAVQSTKDMDGLGFHKRNGQDQYRLVEMTGQGEIVPVDYKRNIIFTDPKEVKRLVPELDGIYEEIPYEDLLKKRMELQESETLSAGEETKEDPAPENADVAGAPARKDITGVDVPGEEPGKGIIIKGFEVAKGMLAAKIIYEGAESREGIWKQGERYYVSTGYAFDHTYQEHDLTEKQTEELEGFIAKNGIVLEKDSPLLTIAEQENGQAPGLQKENGTKFLDALQRQQFQTQVGLTPELSIGLE